MYVVLEAARNYFNARFKYSSETNVDENDSLSIVAHIKDGQTFLRSQDNKHKYDVLLLDASDDISSPPSDMHNSVRFYEECISSLNPISAVLAINVCSSENTDKLTLDIMNRLNIACSLLGHIKTELFVGRVCDSANQLIVFELSSSSNKLFSTKEILKQNNYIIEI